MDEPAPDTVPAATSSEPSRPSRWRELRRRVPNLLLLVAIAAVILYTLHQRPVSVEVVYELGSARRGLVAARMVYLAADGEEVRRVSFDYAQHPPATTQAHAAELLRGDYRVELELEYRAGAVPPGLTRARRSRSPDGRERVHLRRPLHVRGKGTVSIFVVGD
jgi:hypothetical protein